MIEKIYFSCIIYFFEMFHPILWSFAIAEMHKYIFHSLTRSYIIPAAIFQ